MYRFPADLDLSSIIGQDLCQLCLGPYDLQLHFSNFALGISVWSDASLLSGQTALSQWHPGEGWNTLEFQKLVNATVAGFKVVDKSNLYIDFTNGLTLVLTDESEQFESIAIHFKDGREVYI